MPNFHTRFDGGVRWRLTALGVEVEGSGIERTPGEPATVTRIWHDYYDPICHWSSVYKIPAVLIIATIATESRGNAQALRKEPGYKTDIATPHRISPGLMQTLISTAREALRDQVDASIVTRQWLFEPENSIRAGAAYIQQQSRKTELDPPLVAAAYNAGGVYRQNSKHNRWKLRQYPIGTGEHCDRFVKWFNDAVDVLSADDSDPGFIHYKDFYL